MYLRSTFFRKCNIHTQADSGKPPSITTLIIKASAWKFSWLELHNDSLFHQEYVTVQYESAMVALNYFADIRVLKHLVT
jgi:hypothetical protein